MLQQPHSLLIHQLRHHIRQNRAHRIEALVCLADVLQPHIVEQDLLHNEDGHRLAELRAGLHDTQTERDNLGGEEKVDDLGAVILDKRADNAEGGETEVLEGARLGGGVEEWVEEERDVGLDILASQRGTFLSKDHSLPPKNSARVSLCEATHCSNASALHTRFDAAAVSCEGFSSGYTEMISCKRDVMTPVSKDSQPGTLSHHTHTPQHHTKRMPQYQRQLRHLLPLLAQLQQRRLARIRIQHLRNPLQHPPIVLADLSGPAKDTIRPMIQPVAISATAQSTAALVHATAIVIRVAILPRHAPVMLLLLLLRRGVGSCCSL